MTATQTAPKRKLAVNGWLLGVLCAVGAALFLGLVYLVVYRGGAVWLPAGPNNDEVIYNRQLVGILTDGQPKGVFGYNEGRAAVGHFGAWGPVLLYLYALPGVLVGAGVNTMLGCNLLFAVAGWAVFARGRRLRWPYQILWGAAVLCCWFPVQQVFSGAAEPLQYFLILAAWGAASALTRSFQWRWLALLAVCCGLTTITRAYTVLLWILPVGVLWRNHRRWSLACVAGAAVSVAGYLVVSRKASATFFSVSIDTTAPALLVSGHPLQGIGYAFTHLGQQLLYLWQEGILPTLQGNFRELGLAALLVLFLLLVTVGSMVWDWRQGRNIRLRVCACVMVLFCLAGLMELYAMYAMTRHLIMLSVVLLGALGCENPRSLCCCLLLAVLLPYQLAGASLPVYQEEQAAQMQCVQTALAQREADQTSEDPWVHTLAYAFRDDVFHGYLYAVPAGMGIQFDQNSYLADSDNPIHAQYVMTGHGSETEARLQTEGWQELVSTQDLIVYERPEGE